MPQALCTSGFVNRRFCIGCFAAALVGLQCLCTSGCQMFRQQGPVSKSVAESRQLSQRGLGAMERGDIDAAEKAAGRCSESVSHRHRCPPAVRRSVVAKRPATIGPWNKSKNACRNRPTIPSLMVRAGEMQLSLDRSTRPCTSPINRSISIRTNRVPGLCAHVEQNDRPIRTIAGRLSTAPWNSTMTIASCCSKPPSCTGN